MQPCFSSPLWKKDLLLLLSWEKISGHQCLYQYCSCHLKPLNVGTSSHSKSTTVPLSSLCNQGIKTGSWKALNSEPLRRMFWKIFLSLLTVEGSLPSQTLNFCASISNRFVTPQTPDFCQTQPLPLGNTNDEDDRAPVSQPWKTSHFKNAVLADFHFPGTLMQAANWQCGVLGFPTPGKKECINFTKGWGNLCR